MPISFSSSRVGALALQASLNRTHFLIVFSSDTGNILSANAVFLAHTGYDLPALRRLRYADLFPEGPALTAPTQAQTKLTCHLQNREAFQLTASLLPIHAHGRLTRIVLMGQPVPEVVGETDDLMSQTLEQTIDAVVTIDEANRVTFFNAAAERLWGLERHAVIGRNVSMLVPPELRSQHDGFVGRHRRTGENRIVGTTRDVPIHRQDGQQLWGSLSISQIGLKDGRKLYTAFVKDVTAEVQRRAETERVGHLVEANLSRIAAAIDGITQRTAAVAGTTTQTASNAHTVADSTEEISQSITEISGSIGLSKDAVDVATQHVRSAGGEAARLNQAATAMSSIVEFIQRIASNINLLALNATIESARAGEAGRGFAIVASEVKGLARQVAEATESISREIADVQSIATRVVGGLENAGTAMTGVQTSVADIAAALEQQSGSTRSISLNMQDTNDAIVTIEDNILAILDAAKAADTLSDESLLLYEALRAAG